jgi:hypothetical protein
VAEIVHIPVCECVCVCVRVCVCVCVYQQSMLSSVRDVTTMLEAAAMRDCGGDGDGDGQSNSDSASDSDREAANMC